MSTEVIVSTSSDGSRNLFQQSIVPPPESPTLTINTASLAELKSYGNNILLFVPTANKFKIKVLEGRVRAELREEEQSRLIVYDKDLDTGINQPYDEKGMESASTRIRNGMDYLDGNSHILEENKIGTVLIAAIENYIERGRLAIDFGLVAIYNWTDNKCATTISSGVTVPSEFLKEAEASGFDDEAKKSGKKTVGKVLGEIFDINEKDWHEVVCGRSRYNILQEAVNKLNIPV